MFFWTDTPIQEIWRQLKFLSSPVNVSNLLSGKTKSGRKLEAPEDLEERSKDIAFCIKQAEEYFIAAQATSLATSPLLYFYGTQVLAKAIVLANDYSTKLADIKYHGLNTRPKSSHGSAEEIADYSNSPEEWEIEKEFGVTHDGLFQKLCGVVGEKVALGQIITFKDSLALTPDLKDVYRRYYNEDGKCFSLYEWPRNPQQGMKIEICFRADENPDSIIDAFPEFGTHFDMRKDFSYIGFVEKSAGHYQAKPTGKLVEGTIAGKFIVAPHQGIYHPATTIFAGLFILSQAVRYKPSLWQNVLRGEKSGIVTLAEQFCGYSQRRLPHDALALIWREEFVFGSPGYLT